MFAYIVLQVTKLIEESTVAKTVKNAIDTDKLLDWLVENSVLSIALEGKNICHIMQTAQTESCCKISPKIIKTI